MLRTKAEAAEVVVDRAQAAEAGDRADEVAAADFTPTTTARKSANTGRSRADEVAAADLTPTTTARKSANTGRSEARIRHTKGGNPRKGEKEEAEDKEDKKE